MRNNRAHVTLLGLLRYVAFGPGARPVGATVVRLPSLPPRSHSPGRATDRLLLRFLRGLLLCKLRGPVELLELFV